jgi:hypothetical protein
MDRRWNLQLGLGAIAGAVAAAALSREDVAAFGDHAFNWFIRPFIAMVEFGLSCF